MLPIISYQLDFLLAEIVCGKSYAVQKWVVLHTVLSLELGTAVRIGMLLVYQAAYVKCKRLKWNLKKTCVWQVETDLLVYDLLPAYKNWQYYGFWLYESETPPFDTRDLCPRKSELYNT
ncbi:5491_t:CDS:2 [Acaulospora morrowiae]|uniref:5491_t:CDS:1 n=1 Tax=Acaulospora morrowiae TaxID=94023 RepID=A0A9N9BG37_9GLOM|nr:5491_t:CDS:2 [Acaulospora morrowiae]